MGEQRRGNDENKQIAAMVIVTALVAICMSARNLEAYSYTLENKYRSYCYGEDIRSGSICI